MPKLLDVIKELGLTHQEVIDILSKQEADKPESQEDEKDVPEGELQEDDKPIELYLSEAPTEESEVEEVEEQDEIIELTQKELDKQIADVIREKLKATRKVPSKGKLVDKPVSNIDVVKRNWFEEIV